MPNPRKPKAPSHSDRPQSRSENGPHTLPVIEEEVSIERVKETSGTVRVRIESREEIERIPVTEIIEEVSIEHVPINRYVEERTEPRQEGDVVIVPVFETVAVVETRLLLKEELRIVRHRREVQREEEVTLQKERPVVERRASNQDEWSQDSQDP